MRCQAWHHRSCKIPVMSQEDEDKQTSEEEEVLRLMKVMNPAFVPRGGCSMHPLSSKSFLNLVLRMPAGALYVDYPVPIIPFAFKN